MFVNPLLLAGASLGSIPIIIHLLHRRRFIRRAWAAVEWLLESERRSRRRLRIEELILLAVRILILVLLASALARPFLRQGSSGRGARAFRIVCLDRSMSMKRAQGPETSFARGVELARHLLSDAAGMTRGDEAAVIVFDSSAETLIRCTSDLASAAEELASVEPTDGGSNAPRALAEALELISSGASKNPRREIFIVTDATAEAWRNRSGALKDSAVLRALKVLGEGEVSLFVVAAASGAGSENLAVHSLRTESKLVVSGIPARLTASVEGWGLSAPREVTVALSVGGAVSSRRAVTVQPDAPAVVSFPVVFPVADAAAVSTRIEPDELVADNECFAVLDVRPDLPVLCIDGDVKLEPLASETALLVRAMSPGRESLPQERSGLSPEVRGVEALEDVRFEKYEVVVLANVGLLSERKVAALERFVATGGGLIIFPGSGLDPAVYNQLLWRAGSGLLPVELESIEDLDLTGLRARGLDHPIMQVFAGIARSGLTTARISHRLLWKMPSGSGAPPAEKTGGAAPQQGAPGAPGDGEQAGKPGEAKASVGVREPPRGILEFSDGKGALVERRFGESAEAGRVMLWAVTADREWSDLPEKPAYLPLVHEMVYHVMRDRWRESNLTVGERFALPVSAEGTLVPFSVGLPGGSVEEVQPEPSGDRIEIRYDGTSRVGFYSVRRSGAVEAEKTFAVNCDPAESNLEPIGEMELRDLLGGWPVRLVTGRQDVAEAVRSSRSGVEFWRELVTAVVVLLLVESVLAWLFGARRAELGLSAKATG